MSRGGFYTTLDRLEKKGYLNWVAEVPEHATREATQRRFSVSPEGIAALGTPKPRVDETVERPGTAD